MNPPLALFFVAGTPQLPYSILKRIISTLDCPLGRAYYPFVPMT